LCHPVLSPLAEKDHSVTLVRLLSINGVPMAVPTPQLLLRGSFVIPKTPC
jgi:hypothetical protein